MLTYKLSHPQTSRGGHSDQNEVNKQLLINTKSLNSFSYWFHNTMMHFHIYKCYTNVFTVLWKKQKLEIMSFWWSEKNLTLGKTIK